MKKLFRIVINYSLTFHFKFRNRLYVLLLCDNLGSVIIPNFDMDYLAK